MARPSQNIDQRLLDSGLALLPTTGCRALSARKLVEHAGVNLGMFHYHFQSKDNFIRILLEQMYEQMFSVLVIKSHESQSPLENLRKALQVLAHFGRRNQALLTRVMADAMAGETVAAEFLRANIPRHIGVVGSLISEAQRAGDISKAPLTQVIAFLAGSIMVPVLLGGALLESGMLPGTIGASLKSGVLSERALNQRIEFALRGLAVQPKGKL
ncbi:hypothetical protein BH11PSE11_BH11PSE11_30940 [soil metagenome]